MSIGSLADYELRSLVRYGSARFAGLAQAELDRRKALKNEAIPALQQQRPTETMAQAAPAFPNGRWS